MHLYNARTHCQLHIVLGWTFHKFGRGEKPLDMTPAAPTLKAHTVQLIRFPLLEFLCPLCSVKCTVDVPCYLLPEEGDIILIYSFLFLSGNSET